jgi:DNA-binding CsgD family transcriptional regulator
LDWGVPALFLDTALSGSGGALSDQPELAGAMSAAFDAALEPAGWQDAMGKFAVAFGAQGASFNFVKAGPERLALPATPAYRDMLHEFYRDGWAAQDLRTKRGWPLFKSGQVVIHEDNVTTEKERRSQPIYTDLFARHDLGMWAGAAFTVDGEPWAHSVARSTRRGRFEDASLARLALAQPVFPKLILLAQRLGQTSERPALQALEFASKPAVLLDWRCRVADMNAPARKLLGDGLRIRDGRFVTDDRIANERLDQLRSDLARGNLEKIAIDTGPIVLPRRQGRPLLIYATPIRRDASTLMGFSGCLLLISDLDAAPKPKMDTLRAAFGLTKREAEVAQLLATGDSLQEIADKLEASILTVRAHLRTVMTKTGCHRQGELVSLLSRMLNEPGADGLDTPRGAL